jgi:acetoin utilization deacetylase AcuC-like enzyme
MIDVDTAAVEATFEAALHAAGGAAALVDALLGGETRTDFAALRPPGHHAQPAARWAFASHQRRDRRPARDNRPRSRRVLIVDWDVHHGDGTRLSRCGKWPALGRARAGCPVSERARIAKRCCGEPSRPSAHDAS